MNELDFILIVIILVGVVVGYRRGLVRTLIGIVGIYIAVIFAGYVYKPIGNTVTSGFEQLGFSLNVVATHNFAYLLALIGITVVIEVASRSSFEQTSIRSIGGLDNIIGAVAGLFYGALWASLFLVPLQYSVSIDPTGATRTAVFGSELVPTLNRVFQNAVVDVVSLFFIGGVPEIYRNGIAQRVAYLLPGFPA